MFLAATWHHIVITTIHESHFRQVFYLMMLKESSGGRLILFVLNYKKRERTDERAVSVFFSCVFVVCRSSVVWFGRCPETASLLIGRFVRPTLELCGGVPGRHYRKRGFGLSVAIWLRN